MKELIEEILKPLIYDDGVLFAGIYRVDGVPIYVHFKDRKIISVIDWLENQVKVLINYIFMGYFKKAEFQLQNSHLILHPLSKTLILCVLAHEDVSLFKLRTDLESVKSEFQKHV